MHAFAPRRHDLEPSATRGQWRGQPRARRSRQIASDGFRRPGRRRPNSRRKSAALSIAVVSKCVESRDHDHRRGADDRIIPRASISRGNHAIDRVRFKSIKNERARSHCLRTRDECVTSRTRDRRRSAPAMFLDRRSSDRFGCFGEYRATIESPEAVTNDARSPRLPAIG